MWIQTHAHLAKLIQQYAKSKYKLALDTEWLQYGSIFPDLAWSGIKCAHFYKEDLPYVMEKINDLLRDGKNLDIKKFSFQLGILHHFIADFFCGAHNDDTMSKNIWAHFLYEMRLHHKFTNLWPKSGSVLMARNPALAIPHMHKKYCESAQGLENDIYYITQCCLGLTEYFAERINHTPAKTA